MYSTLFWELDTTHFLSAPRLTWQIACKKAKVIFELLTDIDMLLIVGNSIRGEICHAIHQYVIANKKYRANYDKDKESSYLKH